MFETKGEQPEWRLLYDVIAARQIGDVVTYDDLGKALGRDFLENRTPIFRAIKELEETHKRTFVNERGVGYRMIEPTEHKKASLAHAKRSTRQLKKAVAKLDSADRSLLGPDDARYFDTAATAVGQLYLNQIALARRLKRHEEIITDVAHSNDVAHDRIAAIEAALAKHGMLANAKEAASA